MALRAFLHSRPSLSHTTLSTPCTLAAVASFHLPSFPHVFPTLIFIQLIPSHPSELGPHTTSTEKSKEPPCPQACPSSPPSSFTESGGWAADCSPVNGPQRAKHPHAEDMGTQAWRDSTERLWATNSLPSLASPVPQKHSSVSDLSREGPRQG